MKCPHCQQDYDKVVDTRPLADGYSVRRRRECLRCHMRFTTYEMVELSTILIIKKNGSKQPYDKEKIFKGVFKACEKRSIEPKMIEQITDKVDKKVRALGKSEIYSDQIGSFIIEVLKDVDVIAYVRFLSAYRQFDRIEDFITEIQTIIKK